MNALAINYADLANHAAAAAAVSARTGHERMARDWRAHARYLRARSRDLARQEEPS